MTGRRVAPAILRARFRGVGGGVIRTHRALSTVDTSRSGLVVGVALGVALSFASFLLIEPICGGWVALFRFWDGALGLPGEVGVRPSGWRGLYSCTLPYLPLSTAAPTPATWWITAVVTLLLLAATLPLARRSLPLAYFARVLVAIQGSALVYFAFADGPLPYTLRDYTPTMLGAGLAIVVWTPLLLGITYNIYNLGIVRKLALSLLCVAHLGIFVPHQYLLHAYLVHSGSQLFLPILYLLGGLILDVAVFVGWYSWGMSWRGRRFEPEDEEPHSLRGPSAVLLAGIRVRTPRVRR